MTVFLSNVTCVGTEGGQLQTHIQHHHHHHHHEQEECREQLCNCGALPALIQLAAMDDEATKLRCVVAFANLSCEYTIRGQMVSWSILSRRRLIV